MIFSKYHKHIEKYVDNFGNKDIFDFLNFIYTNKFKLFWGLIFSFIISFFIIYFNIQNTPYISTVKIEPYFVNLTYPADISKNINYYNQSLNREEFLQKVFKDFNQINTKQNLNKAIKLEILVNEFNQNSLLKIYLTKENSKENLNKIILSLLKEIKDENFTIEKNLHLVINNPVSYFKSQLEVQENLINISIKMKIIIDKLIKKYKIDISEQNFSNSAYIYSALDHSTLFTSIIASLINSNKVNFKEIDADIKSFTILKNDFDIQFNRNYDLSIKLRNNILPIFNFSNIEYLSINEKKNLYQENIKILISTLVLGFLLSLIICFCIDFYRNYKIRYKGNN